MWISENQVVQSLLYNVWIILTVNVPVVMWCKTYSELLLVIAHFRSLDFNQLQSDISYLF